MSSAPTLKIWFTTRQRPFCRSETRGYRTAYFGGTINRLSVDSLYGSAFSTPFTDHGLESGHIERPAGRPPAIWMSLSLAVAFAPLVL